ncbi:MAG: hypothetical protein R3F54_23030 [Alphaproteobacteria bacterium]
MRSATLSPCDLSLAEATPSQPCRHPSAPLNRHHPGLEPGLHRWLGGQCRAAGARPRPQRRRRLFLTGIGLFLVASLAGICVLVLI